MTIPGSDAVVLVDQVSHRYGNAVVLSDVTLTIARGEFVTLLGPSGCGKTTLLRIIAGFAYPRAGRIFLSGHDVTDLPPHKRPVNTVFQRPMLFPHLDVGENVAFGLRLTGMPGEEVARRVSETLDMVRLGGFERRAAHELSGGQMQRVALARVLAGRPKVLLLDEPLSALDLAIRLEMESELRRVHREIGATFVYVTHDQREALALSDRIVVLNRGRVEQAGAPGDIYRTPASPFAARFVGDANVLPVDVAAVRGNHAEIAVGGRRLVVLGGEFSGPAWLVVRPEAIRLGDDRHDGAEELRGQVLDCAFRGAGYSYRIAVPGVIEPIKAEIPAGALAPYPVGSAVTVAWDVAACSLLRREGTH